jgi:primosomal protein N'
MANTSYDIHSFMQQWLQTATAGKVDVEYAWLQDRMTLKCHQCGAIYRCDVPSSPHLIDFTLQGWVNKHSPMGVHDKEELKSPLAPIPMTADFKHPTSWDGISKKPFGNIDESAAKAELIKAQMEKYKAEKETENLDQKIAFLQQTAKQKAALKAAEEQNDLQAKEVALQNLLQLMSKMSRVPLTKIEPEPEPPATKTVRIVTGRRFR